MTEIPDDMTPVEVDQVAQYIETRLKGLSNDLERIHNAIRVLVNRGRFDPEAIADVCRSITVMQAETGSLNANLVDRVFKSGSPR